MPAQYAGLRSPVMRASISTTCARSRRRAPRTLLRWIKSAIRRRRRVHAEDSTKEDFMLSRSLLSRSLSRVLVVATALALSALAQAQPIRIGAFLAVTGPAAFLGDPEQKTLELYVEKLNAAGGVLGRKLALVAYDDGGDAEKARTFAKRLIEQDKVDLIVGGTTTGTTMAAVPLVEAAQMPFISLA